MEIEATEEKEISYEEFEGEVGPRFICAKKEIPEELECETDESYTCTEIDTTTGNILERLITHPISRRPPCLRKWPTEPPKSESEIQDNTHQFKAFLKQTPLSQMCALRVASEPYKIRLPAIICTLGPATANVTNILELLEAGMNVARISMAHCNSCTLNEPFKNVIEASNQYSTIRDFEIPIAIMMDLKGPEIRTGKINFGHKNSNQNELHLKANCYVRLTSDSIFSNRCSDKYIYIDYPHLLDVVSEDMIIGISDSTILLKVNSVELVCILCTVVTGGILRDFQKVQVKGVPLMLPALSDYDKECLKSAAELDVDVVVVSYVRNSEAIAEARKILSSVPDGNNILVFAKISSYEGIENIDEILHAADGIVIEEADICSDIPPEKMLVAQKGIIGKCNRVGKPVLRTGKISFPNETGGIPKRIAMNDIGGAIVDGVDGIILKRDTAVDSEGCFNVIELSKIIKECDAATMHKFLFTSLVEEQEPSLEPCQAIALAAVQISTIIQATAILVVTTSGRTAHMLSWYRPRCPVIAITRNAKVARQMNFWRSLVPLHFSAPVLSDWFLDVKARFQYGIAFGKENDILRTGDLLVLVSGYRKNAGFTNCIRIVYALTEKSNFDDNLTNYYAASKENSSTEKFKM